MASIHWLAWIGIGLAVVITAQKIGGNLALFFWVGLIFLLIGVGKLVHKFVFTPREKKIEAKNSQSMPRPVRCPRCMTSAHPADNYCRICGTPLRMAHPAQTHVRTR